MTNFTEILGLAGVLVAEFSAIAVLGAWASSGQPDEPAPRPEPERERGHRLGLIQRQRAWAHAQPTSAQSSTATAQSSGDAVFTDWFCACIALPAHPTANDVVPYAMWTHSFTEYCARHARPLLSHEDLMDTMQRFADANSCILTADGDLTNAQLTIG
jgi:hypothetical protein